MSHPVHRFLALAAVLSVAACSRTDVFVEPLPPPPPDEFTVSIDPPEQVVGLGRSAQFTATVEPEWEVEWTVRPDEAIGSVDENGLFTGPDAFPGPFIDEMHGWVRATVKDHPEFFAEARVTIIPAGLPPADLVKISGEEQTVVVGEAPEVPLVVRVFDTAGAPAEGVVVRFRSPYDDSAVNVVTDAAGYARGQPLAGVRPGPQTFPVESDGLSTVTFTLEAVPGALHALKATHPDPRGVAGAALELPLALTFLDRFDNVLADRSAQGEAPVGGAAEALDAYSSEEGVQRFSIMLGHAPGPQTFRFFAGPEGPETTIDFLALGGEAARVELFDGDDQEGVVGQELAEPLRVRVLDANGYPAAGGLLGWTSPDGAVIVAAQTTADADGIAAARVRLPNRAGTVRVVCSAPGLQGSPITFHVRAVASAAQRLQLVSGADQTTTAGERFGAPFVVRVTDGNQNGVAGVSVGFSSVAGGGRVDPDVAITGPDGRASAVMYAGDIGNQRYRASVPGLVGSPVEVTGTAVPAVSTLRLELVSGNNQTGSLGTDLGQPLVVRVVSNVGVPLAGQTVTFGVESGGGSVRPTTSITATNGTAQTTARLGPTPGPQRYFASLPGAQNSPLFFDARAEGTAVDRLRIVSGNGQIARPGEPLPQPFVVEALDIDGRPVPDAAITFSPPAGGSVTPAVVPTDLSGRASSQGRLASSTGEQVFTAGTPGAQPVTFRATSREDAPSLRLEIVSGQGQSADLGGALPQQLVVRVVYEGTGSAADGIEVRWSGESPGSQITPSVNFTDAQGLARASATLGAAAGTQRFFAESPQVAGPRAVFLANARALPAERLIIASGDGQTGTPGTALAQPLVARAVDAMGNGVAGVEVTFAAAIGSGQISPARVTTDAAGNASANAVLGSAVGTHTFTASAAGLEGSPVTFTATATRPVNRISISPAGVRVAAGASVKYTATAIFDDGSSAVITEEASWASTNTQVATVSDSRGSKGVVTTLAQGTTGIRASYGGRTGEATLRVDPAELTSVLVLPAGANIVTGSERAFRAWGNFSNNTVAEVTESAQWTSSATLVATVSNTSGSRGLVRGISPGVSTITATFSGVSGSQEVTVSRSPLQYLEITPLFVSQPAGTAVSLRATATYEDGTVEDVTSVVRWESSDTDRMTVQNAPAEAGRATLIAPGTPEARATLAGVTATRTVRITEATVQSLTITPNDFQLAVYDTRQLTLYATYTDGTVADATQIATWTSSRPDRAEVSNAPGTRGLVTGISSGNAQITAQLGGMSATAIARVSNPNTWWVEVTAPGGTTCAAGTVLQLRAFAVYSNFSASDITRDASWFSSNTQLAVVGQGPAGGEVRCLAAGQVNITARWNGNSGSRSIRVTGAELVDISIAPTSAKMARGDVQPFYATGRYSDGSQRDITDQVTWTSTDSNVVAVSNAQGNEGRATGIGPGTAHVIATKEGVEGRAEVEVTGARLMAIIISPANPVIQYRPPGFLRPQQQQQFNATAFYDDLTTLDVTALAVWATTNTSVGTMSPTVAGRVMIEGVGTTQVIANYAGNSGNTTLTVR